MERMAVSLPAGTPSGTVLTSETIPRRARPSIVGFCAASSGVRPPNASTGKSAMPSPMTSMYFINLALLFVLRHILVGN